LNVGLLDGLAFAGPEHLDSRSVDGYDRKARVDPDPDLALLRARRGADSTLVDLGAATGTFALAAAAEAARVVAVDPSPLMVAAAQAKKGGRGHERGVRPEIEQADYYGSLRVYAEYLCVRRQPA
jgi:SAM-dependent methyltransferase